MRLREEEQFWETLAGVAQTDAWGSSIEYVQGIWDSLPADAKDGYHWDAARFVCSMLYLGTQHRETE